MNGLESGEKLDDNSVKLLTAKQLVGYSEKRREDTFKFLVDVDYSFAKKIKKALADVGYKGLFTGTNNWYGYGNLWANYLLGNYVEMHGYFDPPKSIKFPVKAVALTNKSYLSSKLTGDESDKSFMSEYAFPLSRTFMAALTDRPMVVSEWNHGTWSDFAYEGILMMTTYSSLQGYPVLDAHTYFNHPNPDPAENVSRTGLTVSNNPVFMALSPSSSLSFINGYISESQYTDAITIANNEAGLADYALTTGTTKSYKEPLSMGFVHKLRTKLISDDHNPVWVPPANDIYMSDTGEIKFDQSGDESGTISVDAEKYKAFFGSPSMFVSKSGNFSVETADHGAVTVVPLDGKEIIESKKILVTVVQSFKNTDENINDTPLGRIIMDTGKSPALLKKVNAEVFIGNQNHVVKVSYINDSGLVILMNDDYDTVVDGTHPGIRLKTGTRNSPWYIVELD